MANTMRAAVEASAPGKHNLAAIRAFVDEFGGFGADTELVKGAEQCLTAAERAAKLKAAIPKAQQGRITMAVGKAVDANGNEITLIGTSEPRGYLRPGVTLNPGETMVAGTGHAEADIVNYAAQNDLSLGDIGATRPICPECAAAIDSVGATPVTPLK